MTVKGVAGSGDSEFILVKILGVCSSTGFKIKKNLPLSSMMNYYRKMVGFNVKFFLDEREICMTDTPLSLQMEDEEEIDTV